MALFVTLTLLAIFTTFLADDFEGWLGGTVLIGAIVVFLFWGFGYWEAPKQDKAAVTNSAASNENLAMSDVNADQDLNDAENKVVADTKKDDPPPKKDDSKTNKDPQNKLDKSTGDKWMDASIRSVQKARIMCDDGIQLKVSAWVQDGTDEPDIVTIWPRLHVDGRPYSCSESKDPSQELSK